jgi:DNA modification methylase
MQMTNSIAIGNSDIYCGDCFDILPKLDIKADAVISNLSFGIMGGNGSFVQFWDLVSGKTKPKGGFVLFRDGNSQEQLDWYTPQKSLAFMEMVIRSCTNEGDIVLDPFMSCGTVAAACAVAGRAFIGIEKKKECFDIAHKRLLNIVCVRLKRAFAGNDSCNMGQDYDI